MLTSFDVAMLQALYEIGPRNLSKVARHLGVSRKKLEFRLKKMASHPKIFLRLLTSLYHTNIGLKKAVIFAEAKAGMEQLLLDCLLANGFWLYVCRSYGTVGEGCTAVYAVPAERCGEFEEFINEIKRLGVAENVQIFWSTCFQGGRITSRWFDNQKNGWIFDWDEWIKEVHTQSVDLPYTLIEPKSYTNYADEIDIQMLMRLEADATKDIGEIAKTLGISRQLAQYHYKNHLLGKNLIEGYDIFIMRYGETPSIMVAFIITFHNYQTLAKFARSLLDKPFVLTIGKIIGENSIMVEIFLPTNEFRKFVDALSTLARMKLIQNYKYAIQDLRIRQRQTISGEFFKNDSWIYDHQSHMAMLWQKVSQFLLTLEQPQIS
jgi:DNA-binding Lrp family transcriptional regulator